MSNQLGSYLAVIKVVGIGGGGSNAVTRMVEAGVSGVEFVAVNTDAQALLMTEADVKIHIGSKATRGLGAGADPRVGLAAARGEPRRAEGGPQGRGHDLRHRRRGRRHRHGRRAGRRADRPRARRAHRRRRHAAVRVRGQAPRRPGRAGHPDAARERRHAHRHRERPAAAGRRALDARDRGVPDGRRHPPPGRPGDHRPDHRPRAHQPRLRRRAHDHARGGLGADGHRRRARRQPRGRGRAGRDLVAAPRDDARRRDGDPPEHHRRPRPRAGRGGRGGAGRHERRGLERERDLRRRDRRGDGRGRPRHRDRDRLRRPPAAEACPRRRSASAAEPERPSFDAPSVSDVEIDIPSFLRED